MPRLPLAFPRAPAVVIAAILGLATAAPAWAQSPEKEPEIDAAPRKVSFKAAAVVHGHLENGAPGDEVALQRKPADSHWRIIATETVDEEQSVRFRLPELRRTADYRLSYTDEVTGEYSSSETRRIRVAPYLNFRVRPTDVFKGRSVTVRGGLYPKASGRRVLVQQKVDGGWRSMGWATVRDGRFSHSFRARHRGYRRIRVKFFGDATSTRAVRRRAVRVYRRALATWYGPGFYGRRTACGRRLNRDTLGVAHRRLPCGTKVSVLYRGRTIAVPVIDRGPYGSADYDLTSRTARRLGFSGKDTIGVRKSS